MAKNNSSRSSRGSTVYVDQHLQWGDCFTLTASSIQNPGVKGAMRGYRDNGVTKNETPVLEHTPVRC